MAVAGSVASEAGTERQPGGHLTERSHDHEDEATDEGVRDEERSGASLSKGLAGTDNQTCAEGTANGNHANVAGFEATVQSGGLGRLETTDVRHLRVGRVDLLSSKGILRDVADFLVTHAGQRSVGACLIEGGGVFTLRICVGMSGIGQRFV